MSNATLQRNTVDPARPRKFTALKSGSRYLVAHASEVAQIRIVKRRDGSGYLEVQFHEGWQPGGTMGRIDRELTEGWSSFEVLVDYLRRSRNLRGMWVLVFDHNGFNYHSRAENLRAW